MSDVSNSFLSGPKYGYDFVVATTQASINSGLLEYLDRMAQQPVTQVFYAIDPVSRLPTKQLSLAELLERTKGPGFPSGINPFDVPANSPYDDPRITALTKAFFVVGLEVQVGLPDGVPLDQLPPIVELGEDAHAVTFRMFCKKIKLIQNSPGSWGQPGAWNTYSQAEALRQPPQAGLPKAQPWYVETRTNLTMADLDGELDTPYFRNNPKEKAAILAKLNNLSGTAFSLQQLFFDLDTAALSNTLPKFPTVPAHSVASSILQDNFVDMYSQACKDKGLPLLAVSVIGTDQKDASRLQMTSFERQVSPLRDDQGNKIKNPSQADKAVTTLDNLCMVGNKKNPGAAAGGFTWNWVKPSLANSESGICAINRQVFAQHVFDQLKQSITQSCTTCEVHAHADDAFGVNSHVDVTMHPNQTPQTMTITAAGAGSNVIHASYDSSNDGQTRSEDRDGLFTITWYIQPSYTCDVRFVDQTIVITQRQTVYFRVEWDYTTCKCVGIDTTVTDTYDLGVDSNGNLTITRDVHKHSSVPNPQAPDGPPGSSAFLDLDKEIEKAKDKVQAIPQFDLTAVEFGKLQNFIFPGGKVFAFKNPRFSANQDLLCDITYAAPNATHATPAKALSESKAQPSGHRGSSDWTSISAAEVEESKLAANSGPAGVRARSISSTGPSSMAAPWAVGSYKSASESTPLVTLTHTSDLIQNYVQGEIVSPTGKFEAVQSDGGHALLFALNTASALHVIEEQSGETTTGWKPLDLSSGLLGELHKTCPQATVRGFEVGQNAVDSTIGLALVVSSEGTDALHLSLHNSSSNTSWTANPNWIHVPWDASQADMRPTIAIERVLFAETQDTQQYIVVDVDRSSNATVKSIERYHVDLSKATGKAWTLQDVPIDIETGDYQSCVGRPSGERSEGVYTSGKVGGISQLVYVPLVNVYGGGPPLPSRLILPGGVTAAAIASTCNADGTTDLYAISGSTLYRFASDHQMDGAVGSPLLSQSIFQGTQQVTAMTHDGVVTIWGKNGSNQVFYTSCLTAQIAVPGAWSSAVPILTDVERISSYINRSDGGNTIFASGGGKLQRLTQSTTTDAKIWRSDEITLEGSSSEEPLSFTSYTTTIQALDSQKLPAGRIDLELTAPSRAPIYINGVYYALSETPTRVSTDVTGQLTMVEPVQNMNGTIITVSGSGVAAPVQIDPMGASFNKLASLNTERALRGASYPSNVVAGGLKGAAASLPLVASTVDSKDINSVVSGMTTMSTIYTSLKPKPKIPAPSAASTRNSSTSGPSSTGSLYRTMSYTQLVTSPAVPRPLNLSSPKCARVVPHTLFSASDSLGGLGDDIAIAAGDLFRWLESGVASVVHVFQDAISGAWHFLASIAGRGYRAALNSVSAVVGAVQWIFDAIKTDIKKLLQYLEFLFDWDDIKRTKDIFYSMTSLWMRHQVDGLKSAKIAFDGQVTAVEKSIEAWSGAATWSALGQVATKPAANSASNASAGQTSGSQMLSTHFKHHAANLTVVGTPPSFDAMQKVVEDLLAALEQEGAVLSVVYGQLRDLAKTFSSKTVSEILQKLAGILATGVLSSVQVVADALFNVLVDLSNAAISLLETKIHVPIISDILNAIGISDLSFLDLLTWLPAMSYTVVYKIAHKDAPFPDSADVKAIIEAPTWARLSTMFRHGATLAAMPGVPTTNTHAGPHDRQHNSGLASTTSHMFAVRRPQTLRSKASIASLAGATIGKANSQATVPLSLEAETLVPVAFAKAIFVAGHGLCAIATEINAFLSALEAEGPSGNAFGTLSDISGLVCAASSSIADMALPRNEITNSAISDLSTITTGVTVMAGVVLGMESIEEKLKARRATSFPGWGINDGRSTKAIVDAVLVIPAAIVTTWHFYELGNEQAGADRSSAIVGEVCNLSSYVARISYAVAVNDADPVTRQIPIGIMAAANVVAGGLQVAQSAML